MDLVTTTLAPTAEKCGACDGEFPTLAEVFSHPCDKVLRTYRQRVDVAEPTRPEPTEDHGTGGRTSTPFTDRASEGQITLIRKLLAERAGHPEVEPIRVTLNTERQQRTHLRKRTARLAIDALLLIPANSSAGTVDTRPTFKPGAGQIDRSILEAIPSGRYWVDGEFVKVDRPDKGQWAGFIFVKRVVNLHGEFEDDVRIAILNPSGATAKVDEGWRSTVEKLVADPMAAAKEFGHRTGSCCVCARTLTDPKSIEDGIGPICAAKFR